VTLVDAGPLVALVNAADRHHAECVATVRTIRGRLVTAWPVVTEAMDLLGVSWAAQARLWDMLLESHVSLLALEQDDLSRMRSLMEKYQDLPMDLADAALVRLAERERIRRVFTLDRRDFAVYRPERLGRFDVIPRGR
jgi:hypothetical protein